jgi:hypothetical protein
MISALLPSTLLSPNRRSPFPRDCVKALLGTLQSVIKTVKLVLLIFEATVLRYLDKNFYDKS